MALPPLCTCWLSICDTQGHIAPATHMAILPLQRTWPYCPCNAQGHIAPAMHMAISPLTLNHLLTLTQAHLIWPPMLGQRFG